MRGRGNQIVGVAGEIGGSMAVGAVGVGIS